MNGMRGSGVAGLLTAIAVAALLPPAAASAGEPGGGGAGRAGTQALQFAVKSQMNISAFQGMLISYQRFLTDCRALRIAANLSLDVNDRTLDVEYEGIHAEESADLTGWDHSGTVKVQMLFYSGEAPILFYYGGGPRVTYSDYRSESLIYGVDGDELEYRYYGDEKSEWLLGLQCLAGVQWTINQRFALHAEYGGTASYTLTDARTSYYRSDNPALEERTRTSIRSPGFTSDGVLVGLSVYF